APQVGMGFLKNVSRAFRRKSVIQPGSPFISEVLTTSSRGRPFPDLKTYASASLNPYLYSRSISITGLASACSPLLKSSIPYYTVRLRRRKQRAGFWRPPEKMRSGGRSWGVFPELAQYWWGRVGQSGGDWGRVPRRISAHAGRQRPPDHPRQVPGRAGPAVHRHQGTGQLPVRVPAVRVASAGVAPEAAAPDQGRRPGVRAVFFFGRRR